MLLKDRVDCGVMYDMSFSETVDSIEQDETNLVILSAGFTGSQKVP